jgi:2-aminoadipate transaminase
MISFVYGDPDWFSLPLDEMAQAAEFLAEHERRDALGYQNPIRSDELNAALADKLARDQRIEARPEQILVTAGSSSGLGTVCDALIDPGDTVLLDAPAWMGATMIFRLAGAEMIGIPIDEHGVDPEGVAAALDRLEREGRRPKFLYTLPTFQNPAGVELSLTRREALARLAEQRGLLIVEDDAYYELRFRGEYPPTIYSLARPGSVLYCGTLSKTIAAGLRLGYIVGPEPVVAALSRARVDSLRNSFSAALADWFLRTSKYRVHLEELRRIYQEKCDRMLRALEREMPEGTTWTKPNGGFFIWLTLPEGVSAPAILPACREAGVDFIPGPAFYADGSGERHLRLSYSAVTLDQIDEGIARLAQVVRQAMVSVAAAHG